MLYKKILHANRLQVTSTQETRTYLHTCICTNKLFQHIPIYYTLATFSVDTGTSSYTLLSFQVNSKEVYGRSKRITVMLLYISLPWLHSFMDLRTGSNAYITGMQTKCCRFASSYIASQTAPIERPLFSKLQSKPAKFLRAHGLDGILHEGPTKTILFYIFYREKKKTL